MWDLNHKLSPVSIISKKLINRRKFILKKRRGQKRLSFNYIFLWKAEENAQNWKLRENPVDITSALAAREIKWGTLSNILNCLYLGINHHIIRQHIRNLFPSRNVWFHFKEPPCKAYSLILISWIIIKQGW